MLSYFAVWWLGQFYPIKNILQMQDVGVFFTLDNRCHQTLSQNRGQFYAIDQC